MKKFFLSITVYLLSALSSGCPKGPDPLIFETFQPQKGSVFTFMDYPIDSSGRIMIDSMFLSKDSVIETGLTILGKTNVAHILYVNLKNNASTDRYYNYEADGNFSVFLQAPISKWITYPIREWKPSTFLLSDTTIDNTHQIIFDSISVSFADDNDRTNPYIQRPIVGVDERSTIFKMTPSDTQKSKFLISWNFAPKIGYFHLVKFYSGSAFDKKYLYENIQERTLISYSLK